MHTVHFAPKSRNEKTGPMPVTTSSAETCPDACPLKASGACYAKGGPLGMHWAKVSRAERGDTLADALAKIAMLPAGTLWRHNQAGDLPGLNDEIDAAALRDLVNANGAARGFTYTHKPVANSPHARANRRAIRDANLAGFTINLSADNLAEADTLAALDIGPVVVVVARDMPERFETPEGRRGIVCPAQTRDNVNCQACGLCARVDRETIIGFRAHGVSAKRAEAIATAA